jgi:hypothetical protein
MTEQRKWQRIILLVVLAYEGLGALLGGSLLIAQPNGSYMDMPVEMMHGRFQDFRVPGVILFSLGILNLLAWFAVKGKGKESMAWIGTSLALGGLAVWFLVEIVILRELHWLHVMWGFPVILGGVVAIPLLPVRTSTLRNAGLICGVLSSLLYVAMNILVARQWPAYKSASQTVSELSAVGAPTRPLWVVLAVGYTLLVTAFGWGVRMSPVDDRRLRITGTLITIYGALGLVWPFAPMHLREALAAGGGTVSDTLHISLAVVTQMIYLAALGLAAVALGRPFRIYSIVTFVALLAFGALSFREAPNVSANRATPLIGVWERVDIGVFLLWVIVLAVTLLVRSQNGRSRVRSHALAQPA